MDWDPLSATPQSLPAELDLSWQVAADLNSYPEAIERE
jgi:hypothetical protein